MVEDLLVRHLLGAPVERGAQVHEPHRRQEADAVDALAARLEEDVAFPVGGDLAPLERVALLEAELELALVGARREADDERLAGPGRRGSSAPRWPAARSRRPAVLAPP